MVVFYNYGRVYMKNSELQYIRGLTREFVREFELIKDNKYDLPLTHFSRHLLIELSLNEKKPIKAIYRTNKKKEETCIKNKSK